jgi:4-amino-4-deoxy-L-arabinose transferase-like glycosyltransferase
MLTKTRTLSQAVLTLIVSTAMTPEHPEKIPDHSRHTSFSLSSVRKRILYTMLLIFLVALGVRLLVWQHNRSDIEQVMTGLTAGYKDDARVLLSGNLKLFLRGPAPPSDATVLAHPPGYAILMAAIFKIFGESDSALRFFQIFCDAVSTLLVFLIALELSSSKSIALIAGLLAALSPQLAYNSLLLLPDSISVLPVLLALYILARARGKALRWPNLILAGALSGLSCWLRPNWLLLPFYVIGLLPFLLPRGQRLRAAVPLFGAAVLVIAPMTIRNLIVFQRFIPNSLGAGVTLIEGIADYDEEGRLGLPRTDMEVLRWEAEAYNRPDYAGSLYNPDGIERERARVSRGMAVIKSRPFWFMGVMLRRAASMLRTERVPVISGSVLKPGSDETKTTTMLRYPGMALKSIQKLFITAIVLPLSLLGIFLLARRRDRRALAILLVVPVYFLSVQSMLHTEYRYLVALQYFLLILVAVAFCKASNVLGEYATKNIFAQRRKDAKKAR